MDGRTYSFESPLASTTDVPIYLANTTLDVPLDPGLFRQVPQGAPSVFDKVYTLGPHPYIQPTVLQIAHEPHPGSPFAGIHQEGLKFPVIPIHPSGSLCRTTFIKFIDSSQQGYESARPVISPVPSDGINPASLNLIRDWPQGSVSMRVSLGHTHQSTDAHPTSSNLLVPSTLPVISCGKTVVKGKERGVPKRPRRFQKTKADPAASLSRPSPSLRPSEKPGGRYSCGICKLDYAQPQGLTRHQCETHKARLCIYCREFTWGRPYLFRKHLVKRHPGIDPDAAIDEAARARRSATIRRGYLPLLQVPISAPKRDSWGRAKPQSHLSQLTSFAAQPSAVTRFSPVFLPEMAYDSQSASTEVANKVYGQEDALLSELLNANDERSVSPSPGELAEAATNLEMSARTVQMWFKDERQSVSLVGFAVVDSLSPALAPVPTPTPPLNALNGNNGSPVVLESSERMPSPPLPIGCNWIDIWAAGTQPDHI